MQHHAPRAPHFAPTPTTHSRPPHTPSEMDIGLTPTCSAAVLCLCKGVVQDAWHAQQRVVREMRVRHSDFKAAKKKLQAIFARLKKHAAGGMQCTAALVRRPLLTALCVACGRYTHRGVLRNRYRGVPERVPNELSTVLSVRERAGDHGGSHGCGCGGGCRSRSATEYQRGTRTLHTHGLRSRGSGGF